MTQEQQEMIVTAYNEAVQSDSDKAILRAIGHAVIASVSCQRKTSDRVKEMVEKDRALEGQITDLRHELRQLEKHIGEDHDPVIAEVRESKLKASGMMTLLKVLGWASAAGGGGAVGWLLAIVNKAGGIQ